MTLGEVPTWGCKQWYVSEALMVNGSGYNGDSGVIRNRNRFGGKI